MPPKNLVQNQRNGKAVNIGTIWTNRFPKPLYHIAEHIYQIHCSSQSIIIHETRNTDLKIYQREAGSLIG